MWGPNLKSAEGAYAKFSNFVRRKEFVNNEPSMDFLKAIVEKAPELQDKKLQVKR
jgi:hypothetical protein